MLPCNPTKSNFYRCKKIELASRVQIIDEPAFSIRAYVLWNDMNPSVVYPGKDTL